jgi:sulfite reductase (NADPH) hemoprotein beta-component
MSAIKGQPLPAILFANDLREGEVLFLGAAGWTRNPAEAAIAHTQAEADALQATGDAAAACNDVVDVYLAEVALDAVGHPTPKHFRERFRTLGPSVRPDLGKQAEFSRQTIAAE